MAVIVLTEPALLISGHVLWSHDCLLCVGTGPEDGDVASAKGRSNQRGGVWGAESMVL